MIFRYLSYKCEQPQNTRVPISLRAGPLPPRVYFNYLSVARGT